MDLIEERRDSADINYKFIRTIKNKIMEMNSKREKEKYIKDCLNDDTINRNFIANKGIKVIHKSQIQSSYLGDSETAEVRLLILNALSDPFLKNRDKLIGKTYKKGDRRLEEALDRNNVAGYVTALTECGARPRASFMTSIKNSSKSEHSAFKRALLLQTTKEVEKESPEESYNDCIGL